MNSRSMWPTALLAVLVMLSCAGFRYAPLFFPLAVGWAVTSRRWSD